MENSWSPLVAAIVAVPRQKPFHLPLWPPPQTSTVFRGRAPGPLLWGSQGVARTEAGQPVKGSHRAGDRGHAVTGGSREGAQRLRRGTKPQAHRYARAGASTSRDGMDAKVARPQTTGHRRISGTQRARPGVGREARGDGLRDAPDRPQARGRRNGAQAPALLSGSGPTSFPPAAAEGPGAS